MSGTKLALKRLSASDLTLFADHFDSKERTRQKAINLDKAALRALYPALVADVEGGVSLPVELAIYGPNGRTPLSVRQHIKIEKKNIRLGQALIHARDSDPGRFAGLSQNDFALLAFVGAAAPTSMQVCLVSVNSLDDVNLHAAIADHYGGSFSQRVGMLAVEASTLNQIAIAAGIPESHPFLSIIDNDEFEDLAQGGETGASQLLAKRRGRVISREELQRAKASAETTGRNGEELLNLHFQQEREAGRIEDFEWTADRHPLSPYDFELRETLGSSERHLDAKSTKGAFENPIHVSMAEIRHMANSGVPYDVYRLFSITEHTAKCRIAKDVGKFATVLMEAVDKLPKGIKVDGFSLDPSVLNFSEDFAIDVAPDDVEES